MLHTFEFADTTWQCSSMTMEEQFEAECLLNRVLGPVLGSVLSGAVHGFAEPLLAFLKSAAVDDEGKFDLARLISVEGGEGSPMRLIVPVMGIDSSSAPVELAWNTLVDGLREESAGIVENSFLALARTLRYTEVSRLFALAVLGGKLSVQVGGKAATIKNMKALESFLGARATPVGPGFKWQLLGHCLAATYPVLRPVAPEGEEVSEG